MDALVAQLLDEVVGAHRPPGRSQGVSDEQIVAPEIAAELSLRHA
jgi:hypothetical protein